MTLGELRKKATELIDKNPDLAGQEVYFFAGEELSDLYQDNQGIVVIE